MVTQRRRPLCEHNVNIVHPMAAKQNQHGCLAIGHLLSGRVVEGELAGSRHTQGRDQRRQPLGAGLDADCVRAASEPALRHPLTFSPSHRVGLSGELRRRSRASNHAMRRLQERAIALRRGQIRRESSSLDVVRKTGTRRARPARRRHRVGAREYRARLRPAAPLAAQVHSKSSSRRVRTPRGRSSRPMGHRRCT